MPQSKALEINLATSRRQVEIHPRYFPLLEIFKDYSGLSQNMKAYLMEVCHPYRSWKFLTEKGRGLALANFQVFRNHAQGPRGMGLMLDIFFESLANSRDDAVRTSAANTLVVILDEILEKAGDRLPEMLPVLEKGFRGLAELEDGAFILVAQNAPTPIHLGRKMRDLGGEEVEPEGLNRLLTRYLEYSLDYWLAEADPLDWFRETTGLNEPPEELATGLEPITHRGLRKSREALEAARREAAPGSRELLLRLVDIPGNRSVIQTYERLPREMERAGAALDQGLEWKLLFLFHLMNLNGLAPIHQRVLAEAGRTLKVLMEGKDEEGIRELLDRTFQILGRAFRRYPLTALECLSRMGATVYAHERGGLVEYFIDQVTAMGFQTPDVKGVGEDWQVRSNRSHVRNIQTWMELAGLSPKRSRNLLSALIINLALFGVFIKDTDLFPRHITGLLNSEVRPVYNLVKQLCRLFPSYFNEIGAEGKLRDTSTSLDEATLRRDRLVHFLRKQAHVESSPQTVRLMEMVFDFWREPDKEKLRDFLPPDILEGVTDSGEYVEGVGRLVRELFDREVIREVKDLITLDEARLEDVFALPLPGVTDTDRDRLRLARTLYQLLYQKYSTDLVGLEHHLDQPHLPDFPDVKALRATLARQDGRRKLMGLLEYLEGLKDLIMSEKVYPIQEDIYYKRHVAVDIPSMYGAYREPKFDAMGLTLRLESLVNTLFQELIDGIDLKLVTRTTLVAIHDALRLFQRGLELEGLRSREFTRQLDLLTQSLNIRGFSFTQYLDIFRGLEQAVTNLVNDHFENAYHAQMALILERADREKLLPKYLPGENALEQNGLEHRVSEIFLRDRIAASVGLQQLDQFMGRIMITIFQQGRELEPGRLRRLMNYDPERAVTPLIPVNPEVEDTIQLGAKGLGLVKTTGLGLPVPPGFIITTEVFRCREVIKTYRPAMAAFREELARHMERLGRLTGRTFGDPENPMLVSVRSGSSISQPGMLNTFLDVGINERIVEGMAANREGNEWFAWDCYRRFLQTYGMSQGLTRDEFDAIMAMFKKKFDLPYKREFYGSQMREVALAYKEHIRMKGVRPEEDPFEQLYQAVLAVMDSWDSPRAQAYRRIMGISDDWGTSATVQNMVYGNLSPRAGSGVIFTHNPNWSGDKIKIWGDYTLYNQGEDVVSGLVETRPVTVEQARSEGRGASLALEAIFPDIYLALRDISKTLVYDHGYSPQEVEFTFEGPDKENLFILQTRDMVLRERRKALCFDLSALPPDRFLGRGIGVSGGGLAGRVVFDLREIRHWRREEPDTPLILVRGDTVPDDIQEIYEADGLLTARGGATSHASIVAHRLNKTCVVGVSRMACDEAGKVCRLAGKSLAPGDWITLDGLEGLVYLGRIDTRMTEKKREAV